MHTDLRYGGNLIQRLAFGSGDLDLEVLLRAVAALADRLEDDHPGDAPSVVIEEYSDVIEAARIYVDVEDAKRRPWGSHPCGLWRHLMRRPEHGPEGVNSVGISQPRDKRPEAEIRALFEGQTHLVLLREVAQLLLPRLTPVCLTGKQAAAMVCSGAFCAVLGDTVALQPLTVYTGGASFTHAPPAEQAAGFYGTLRREAHATSTDLFTARPMPADELLLLQPLAIGAWAESRDASNKKVIAINLLLALELGASGALRVKLEEG